MLKRIRKRLFLALSVLATLPAGVLAYDAVQVTPESGEPVVFKLSGHPTLTIGEACLTMTTDYNDDGVEFDASRVHTFSFVDTKSGSTGLDNAVSSSSMVSLNGDVLSLSNFSPDTRVSIYNVNGVLVRDLVIGVSGRADISLSGLSQGVYVLDSSQIRFKFRK